MLEEDGPLKVQLRPVRETTIHRSTLARTSYLNQCKVVAATKTLLQTRLDSKDGSATAAREIIMHFVRARKQRGFSHMTLRKHHSEISNYLSRQRRTSHLCTKKRHMSRRCSVC